MRQFQATQLKEHNLPDILNSQEYPARVTLLKVPLLEAIHSRLHLQGIRSKVINLQTSLPAHQVLAIHLQAVRSPLELAIRNPEHQVILKEHLYILRHHRVIPKEDRLAVIRPLDTHRLARQDPIQDSLHLVPIHLEDKEVIHQQVPEDIDHLLVQVATLVKRLLVGVSKLAFRQVRQVMVSRPDIHKGMVRQEHIHRVVFRREAPAVTGAIRLEPHDSGDLKW